MVTEADLLDGALERYVRLASHDGRRDVTTVLTAITMLAVGEIAAVGHASVVEVGDDDAIRCLAATDCHPLVLDNIQRMYAQGPSLDAETVVLRVDDLDTESRWPEFTAAALASTPIRAVLALRVVREGRCRTVLNLYADASGAFDTEATATGAMVAAYVAEALTWERRGRTTSPPARRDVVNDAKLRLMERFGIDVAQALAVLMKIADHQHHSISAVARQLTTAEPLV